MRPEKTLRMRFQKRYNLISDRNNEILANDPRSFWGLREAFIIKEIALLINGSEIWAGECPLGGRDRVGEPRRLDVATTDDCW